MCLRQRSPEFRKATGLNFLLVFANLNFYMTKRALITGITGQDGSYLAEFLLAKGYEVYGFERRASNKSHTNIHHLTHKIHFISGDLTDQSSLVVPIAELMPDEVYNLAAQSFVGASWDQPEYTGNVTALGTLRVLEAILHKHNDKKIKFYQASSSEMFGRVKQTPQNEDTPFYPRSPYGFAKVYAHHATVNYRESYGMFAVNGILFNHESERRGIEFVTRKITDGLVRVKLGIEKDLKLGSLDSKRDWGYAPEYVEAMWMMLQEETPDDYVIATGVTHTVREFVEASAKVLGMNIEWRGKGVDEIGVDTVSGKTVLVIDPKFFRPAEVELLLGDPTKAKTKLGWEPKVKFEELVRIMTHADLSRLRGK